MVRGGATHDLDQKPALGVLPQDMGKTVGRSVAYITSDPPGRAGASRSFQDETLSGRIELDDGSFERCTFRRAVLVYAGGVPPCLRECTFREVSFEFSDAAGRSLAFLQALSAPSSGLRDVFKASFPQLFGH